MVDKIEVDAAISIISSIISLVEKIDPNAAENKIVVDLNKVIGLIQSIGL